jgi:hypothetical protein
MLFGPRLNWSDIFSHLAPLILTIVATFSVIEKKGMFLMVKLIVRDPAKFVQYSDKPNFSVLSTSQLNKSMATYANRNFFV